MGKHRAGSPNLSVVLNSDLDLAVEPSLCVRSSRTNQQIARLLTENERLRRFARRIHKEIYLLSRCRSHPSTMH